MAAHAVIVTRVIKGHFAPVAGGVAVDATQAIVGIGRFACVADSTEGHVKMAEHGVIPGRSAVAQITTARVVSGRLLMAGHAVVVALMVKVYGLPVRRGVTATALAGIVIQRRVCQVARGTVVKVCMVEGDVVPILRDGMAVDARVRGPPREPGSYLCPPGLLGQP